MEAWVVANLPWLCAIIAGGGAMAWRMWHLEQFVKESSKESRAERQRLALEMAELKGILYGKGLINGVD